MNMFNVKNDCWDVCKPPTFFSLGREGPKRGVSIYSQGAAHTCAESGPLLPLHQHLRGSGPFA